MQKRMLAEDEGGASRRAALLRVSISEDCALARDAIDVRRLVTHQAHGVGADLRDADVIAEDDENVRLLCWLLGLGRSRETEE